RDIATEAIEPGRPTQEREPDPLVLKKHASLSDVTKKPRVPSPDTAARSLDAVRAFGNPFRKTPTLGSPRAASRREGRRFDPRWARKMAESAALTGGAEGGGGAGVAPRISTASKAWAVRCAWTEPCPKISSADWMHASRPSTNCEFLVRWSVN